VNQLSAGIEWRWCSLEDLNTRQLYALLAARSAVFVVEQNCAYEDLDGADLEAQHLIAWCGTEVAACVRVLAPGVKYPEPSIGRVLTTKPFRASGLGRELMARAVARCEELFPGRPIRIGAQAYLERFYGSFGFVRASDAYMEDGIAHIEMRRERGPRP
jgi:ElaA protein